MPETDVIAAGAVVLSPEGSVLVVHRPKYDDWSFPKGKLDRGEQVAGCAIRETREETGLDIRLGVPLTAQRYPTNGRHKRVHYWVGRVVGPDDVSGYQPNPEIDDVRWVPVAEAERLLTYPYDRDTLAEALAVPRKIRTLIVLRHGPAHQRSGWRADDRFRPLLRAGQGQATRLVPVLAAYDATRLVSSSSTRCVETLLPYSGAAGEEIEAMPALSEEEATPDGVRVIVTDLLSGAKRAVVCTHRPVLVHLFGVLGLPDPHLEPGEMCVVHLRKGVVVAIERHLVP
ncbi:MAG: NUDIX domain-containing protein [Nocardioides sp.]|nr:NUDIX domain-containing protein [Nocardioides sp.]